ncbi:hypothetical protein ABH905_000921 [Pseudomonas frederiksbergensis]
MFCSCSTTNVSRNHVDTTVTKFVADLYSGQLIEVLVELVAITTVDGREVISDFLVAFARISRPQLMKASEFMRVEEVSSGTDGAR